MNLVPRLVRVPKKLLSPGFSNLKIAITLEPKVVDPYNLGDSWSVDRDLSSGKSVPFSEGGGKVGLSVFSQQTL